MTNKEKLIGMLKTLANTMDHGDETKNKLDMEVWIHDQGKGESL